MEDLKAELMLLTQRVTQLEGVKADVEVRLRKLERAIYMAAGALALLQIILKYAH